MGERGYELPPTTSLGQYEIRARIGSGGMGDVYDAMHTALNRRVAIKTLRRRFLDDETVVARFLREGQLASRIRHPNIVDVTDVGMIGGLPCLVMEHLEGEPFGALLKREGPIPLPTLVDLLLPIVAAVDFAHERGVLHRDIKPSNIFLARSWNGDITPKILDFGISKLIDESQQAGLTTDSAFVGTPHYASPELMRADRHADGRSDQYSMGVVLYEASCGTKPFAEKGGSFVTLAMAICSGEYPPLRNTRPDIPAAFDAVVMRAMALRAEDRYPSMRALGAALLPFASERARLIWTPTFAGSAPGKAGTPHEGTQVILRPSSASTGVAAVRVLGTTGPSYPSLPHPSASGSGSLPMVPSATPPAGAYDRTPSYALGPGSLVGVPPNRSSSTATLGVIVAGALAVLAIVGIAIVKLAAHPASAGTPPSTTASAGASLPTSYDVAVNVVPQTATFELDGVAAGSGALARTLPRDGRMHALRISAGGYETLLLEFDDTHLPPASVVLRPVGQGGPTSTPTPTPNTANAGTRPSSHGGSSGGGASKPAGGAKNPDNRPRTDNIDPWE